MSSLDGTTPTTYEEELEDHYDPERFVTLRVSEAEALRLLDQRMRDLQDLPPTSESSGLIFELVGETRTALTEMDTKIQKKKEAAAKRKLKAQTKPKAKPKAKPKTRQKPSEKEKETEETTAEVATK